MPKKIRLIIDTTRSAVMNMAVDEWLVEQQRTATEPPTLRIYRWDLPSVSVGYFQTLDARTGDLLWKSNLGSVQIYAAPITYQVDGKQYVSVICGNILVTYGLRE